MSRTRKGVDLSGDSPAPVLARPFSERIGVAWRVLFDTDRLTHPDYELQLVRNRAGFHGRLGALLTIAFLVSFSLLAFAGYVVLHAIFEQTPVRAFDIKALGVVAGGSGIIALGSLVLLGRASTPPKQEAEDAWSGFPTATTELIKELAEAAKEWVKSKKS